jgi:hypothetical protein
MGPPPFSGFLKDLSVIVASCTAIYGIGSWRREYVGKKWYGLQFLWTPDKE